MTDPGTPALAVFDLCDTLYAENTTLGFVRFALARGNRRMAKALLDLLHTRRLPVHYALALLHRLFGIDAHRWATVRLLRGGEAARLAEAARAYAAEALPGKANAATLELLAAHRAAGDRVVIVSNSLDIVVRAVAERLGVAWRASRLGFAGGRCTGRIEADLTGRKAGVLSELVAGMPVRPVVHAYTDNLSDRDLIAAADRPTVVIPPGRTRTRWGAIDAVFIDL